VMIYEHYVSILTVCHNSGHFMVSRWDKCTIQFYGREWQLHLLNRA